MRIKIKDIQIIPVGEINNRPNIQQKFLYTQERIMVILIKIIDKNSGTFEASK